MTHLLEEFTSLLHQLIGEGDLCEIDSTSNERLVRAEAHLTQLSSQLVACESVRRSCANESFYAFALTTATGLLNKLHRSSSSTAAAESVSTTTTCADQTTSAWRLLVALLRVVKNAIALKRPPGCAFDPLECQFGAQLRNQLLNNNNSSLLEAYNQSDAVTTDNVTTAPTVQAQQQQQLQQHPPRLAFVYALQYAFNLMQGNPTAFRLCGREWLLTCANLVRRSDKMRLHSTDLELLAMVACRILAPPTSPISDQTHTVKKQTEATEEEEEQEEEDQQQQLKQEQTTLRVEFAREIGLQTYLQLLDKLAAQDTAAANSSSDGSLGSEFDSTLDFAQSDRFVWLYKLAKVLFDPVYEEFILAQCCVKEPTEGTATLTENCVRLDHLVSSTTQRVHVLRMLHIRLNDRQAAFSQSGASWCSIESVSPLLHLYERESTALLDLLTASAANISASNSNGDGPLDVPTLDHVRSLLDEVKLSLVCLSDLLTMQSNDDGDETTAFRTTLTWAQNSSSSSLILTNTCQLLLHAATVSSPPTASSTLSSSSSSSSLFGAIVVQLERTFACQPMYNFKCMLIRFIGVLIYENRANQERLVHDNVLNTIATSLDVDECNPFVREWSIVSLRHILDCLH